MYYLGQFRSFCKVGRHPLVGVVAGCAGAGRGFTANLLVAGTDALLAVIFTEAAAIIDSTGEVTAVDNWYFNIISVFVLTIIGDLVISRFIEPRLGKYEGDEVEETYDEELPRAKKGGD